MYIQIKENLDSSENIENAINWAAQNGDDIVAKRARVLWHQYPDTLKEAEKLLNNDKEAEKLLNNDIEKIIACLETKSSNSKTP